MSEEKAPLQRQVEVLQLQVAELQKILSEKRLGLDKKRPVIRVAQTIADGSYPTQSGTAFSLKFRDSTFTESDGTELLFGDFLDTVAQRVGLTVPARFIAEGEDVLVAEIDGRHYIIGGAGGGAVSCVELHEIHDVPGEPQAPPNLFVPTYSTDGNCDSILVVECGQDVTAPCHGCTAESPTYLLMSLTGADFSDPVEPTNPSINGFDIAVGQEITIARTSRCVYIGSIDYWLLGEDPGVDPPSQMVVRLEYIAVDTEWKLTFTAGGDVIGFAEIAGPYDCMVQHCFNADSGETDLTGYEFTGAQACFDSRDFELAIIGAPANVGVQAAIVDNGEVVTDNGEVVWDV